MVVAVILAIGMCTAVNIFTIGAILEGMIALQNSYGGGVQAGDIGLSENATQVLTGWGGGIIGVIGALVGYKAGETRKEEEVETIQQAQTYVGPMTLPAEPTQ